MFELPENRTEQVRADVVNRLVEAMFRKESLMYCDEYVSMDGVASFRGRWDGPRDKDDNRKFVAFSDDERKAAFEIFEKKGYHIARETWYSANCSRLWCYVLRERRDTPEDRDFTWIF